MSSSNPQPFSTVKVFFHGIIQVSQTSVVAPPWLPTAQYAALDEKGQLPAFKVESMFGIREGRLGTVTSSGESKILSVKSAPEFLALLASSESQYERNERTVYMEKCAEVLQESVLEPVALFPQSSTLFEAHVCELEDAKMKASMNQFTLHRNVVCDGCVKPLDALESVRYKCNPLTGCPDFDYCEACFSIEKLPPDAYHNVKHKHFHECIPIQRAVRNPSDLRTTSAAELVINALANYTNLPFLGTKRSRSSSQSASLTSSSSSSSSAVVPASKQVPPNAPFAELFKYDWVSYSEVLHRVMAFGTSLQRFVPSRSFIGIFAPNCVEWVVADFACLCYSYICVAIHAVYNADVVENIVTKTDMQAIVLKSSEQLETILRIKHKRNADPSTAIPLKFIIAIDPIPTSQRARAMDCGLVVYDFHALVELSSSLSSPDPIVFTPPDELSTLVYTSGSTGLPKGAMFSEKLVFYDIAVCINRYEPTPLLILEQFPFAWMTGRLAIRNILIHGGGLAIFSGASHELMQEYKAVEPTRLLAVPAVWNQLFLMYKNFVRNKRAVETNLSEDIEDDSSSMESTDISTTSRNGFPYLDEFKLTYPLGSRLESAVTGGAMASPDLLAFLKVMFSSIYMNSGFGTTEAGSVLWNNMLRSGNKAKLIDHPELGYTKDDKPFPRGELAVRNSHMIGGYFKDEASTNAKFVDGWFHTGDIVESLGLDRYRAIDRVASFFKLANGEWLSPEMLEGVYSRSSFVSLVFVYGDISRSGVVVVISPNVPALTEAIARMESTKQFDGTASTMASEEDLIKHLQHPAIQTLVWADVARVCKEANLPSSQFPIAIHLTPVTFTAANGLLTPSMKPNRHALQQYFQKDIHNMYAKVEERLLEQQQGGDLIPASAVPTSSASSAAESSSTTSQDRLSAILAHVLGVSREQLSQTVDLSKLGMSSVATMQFVNTVKKETGAQLPLQMLLSQGNDSTPLTVSQLADMVEHKKQEAYELLDKQEKDESSLMSADLMLSLTPAHSSAIAADNSIPIDAIVREACLASVLGLKTDFQPQLTIPTAHVLLTGATGFLGGQILHDLLTQSSSTILHCLVKPSSPSPSPNLSESLKQVSSRLHALLQSRSLWREEWASRIVVHAASIECQHFNLPDEVYQSLLKAVTTIYHSAAQVNWILPYTSLRDANVLGTQNIIHFAAMAQQHSPIRLIHVSTIGVARRYQARDVFLEEHWMDKVQSSAQVEKLISMIGSLYPSGYNRSKWLSEWLVCRARREVGLDVIVVRPGFIGPHSTTGDSGPRDFLTRYVQTVIKTQQYVDSDKKFEFTPVDIMSQRILSIPNSDRLLSTSKLPVYSIEAEISQQLSYRDIGRAIFEGLAIFEAVRAESYVSADKALAVPAEQFVAAVSRDPQCPLYPLFAIISSPGYFRSVHMYPDNDVPASSSLSQLPQPSRATCDIAVQRCAQRLSLAPKQIGS